MKPHKNTDRKLVKISIAKTHLAAAFSLELYKLTQFESEKFYRELIMI